MPKNRFSSVDIQALVRDLQNTVLGMRVTNVYDINSKTYLLKLAVPDKKAFLLLESGTRFHTTDFSWEKQDVPSVFTMKMRKNICTKRLESVRQIGIDRVVEFTFGTGPVEKHLIMELYSSGNLILTESDYTIIALIRTHAYSEEDVIQVGAVYPFHKAKQFNPLTKENLLQILTNGAENEEPLKQTLNTKLDLGTELIEHCIIDAALDYNFKPQKSQGYSSETVDKLYDSLKNGESIFTGNKAFEGWIVLKDTSKPSAKKDKKGKKPANEKSKDDNKKVNGQAAKSEVPSASTETVESQAGSSEPNKAGASSSEASLILYDEFIPILYNQCQASKNLHFPSFNKAVDEFYSKLETQKIAVQRNSQEASVMKKLAKTREEHQKRIDGLYAAEQENERKARLIEENLQDIDNCLLIVRSAIASSMNWSALNTLIKEEKKRDPTSLANLIHKLKLENNIVTLLLSSNSNEDDEDNDGENDENENVQKQAKKPTLVDIDISLSAYSNACNYYGQKKISAQKAQKTIDHTEHAIKASERKARQALTEVKQKAIMSEIRKTYWFEKFHWFISSENYLVIGGRDMQQNELLFKRYLGKDDVYVHADLHGAPSVIVKNHTAGTPIPPLTLQQAGALTVCRSGAWEAKIVTSAWWVFANQVSKTAPTGEYLVTGSFMIRGKKNYLLPTQLIMGFGILFRVNEDSIVRHIGERSIRGGLDENNDEKMDELEDSEESDSDEGKNKDEDKESEKHLRKYEKAKIKKMEKEKNYGLEDGVESGENESSVVLQSITEKYKVKLVPDFEDENKDSVDSNNNNVQTTVKEEKEQKGKKKMSAKERKMLKKGKKPGSKNEQEKEEDENTKEEGNEDENVVENSEKNDNKSEGESESEEEEEKEEEETQTKQKIQNEKVPRGKHGKLKKMKSKYKDQDDEERAIKLAILGSQGKKEEPKKETKQVASKDKGKDKGKEKSKEKGKEKVNESHKEGFKQCYRCGSTEHIASDCPKNNVSENANDEKRMGRREKKIAQEAENAEIEKLMEEEKLTILQEEQKSQLTNLDALTGQPHIDDVLLYGLTVCAPYSVLTNYKFKTKLTPGHSKRGKVGKSIISYFTKLPNITPQEKELIKLINDNEITQTMVSNSKVHLPQVQGQTRKETLRKAASEKSAKDSLKELLEELE